tara:strand:- start:5171 stop:5359 length:189 start_codon:yes stop_codon:yes gene_type:complete
MKLFIYHISNLNTHRQSKAHIITVAFRMAFAQGVALVLECGWIKGLGLLFLQLLPLVLPINT